MKSIIKCPTCANQLNGNYCTMSTANPDFVMTENKRAHKRCRGYKKLLPKPKKLELPKREFVIDYERLGPFGKFIERGGHYSFRINKVGI